MTDNIATLLAQIHRKIGNNFEMHLSDSGNEFVCRISTFASEDLKDSLDQDFEEYDRIPGDAVLAALQLANKGLK